MGWNDMLTLFDTVAVTDDQIGLIICAAMITIAWHLLREKS